MIEVNPGNRFNFLKVTKRLYDTVIKCHIELVPFTYTQNWKACWPFEFFKCPKSLVAYNIPRIENPGNRWNFLVTKRLAVIKCTQDRKPWQLLLFFMYQSARRLKYTQGWNKSRHPLKLFTVTNRWYTYWILHSACTIQMYIKLKTFATVLIFLRVKAIIAYPGLKTLQPLELFMLPKGL